MHVSHRTIFTASVVLMGFSVYACGATSDTSVPDGPADPFGAPGPGGGKGDGASTSAADAATPGTCELTVAGAARGPEIEDECRACAAEKCCARLDTCYRAAPAPAGLAGADGVKTACELFGVCEATCSVDGGAACEEACELKYGSAAAADWFTADSCLYEQAPHGCACP